MQYYKNYQKDLLKSRQTPLLIELNKKDLIRFSNDFKEGLSNIDKEKVNSFDNLDMEIAILTVKEIYDSSLKTNNLQTLYLLIQMKKMIIQIQSC